MPCFQLKLALRKSKYIYIMYIYIYIYPVMGTNMDQHILLVVVVGGKSPSQITFTGAVVSNRSPAHRRSLAPLVTSQPEGR